MGTVLNLRGVADPEGQNSDDWRLREVSVRKRRRRMPGNRWDNANAVSSRNHIVSAKCRNLTLGPRLRCKLPKRTPILPA
jgi:hypothetical protein